MGSLLAISLSVPVNLPISHDTSVSEGIYCLSPNYIFPLRAPGCLVNESESWTKIWIDIYSIYRSKQTSKISQTNLSEWYLSQNIKWFRGSCQFVLASKGGGHFWPMTILCYICCPTYCKHFMTKWVGVCELIKVLNPKDWPKITFCFRNLWDGWMAAVASLGLCPKRSIFGVGGQT